MTPSSRRVLLHGLRQRCPRCGQGAIFVGARGLAGRELCAVCGWRLVRGEGHWIGGAEINLVATSLAGTAVCGGLVLLLGFGWPAFALGGAFMVAFSIRTHRLSRGLFYALDFLVDSEPDAIPPGGPGRDLLEPGPDRSGPPALGPARRAPVPARPVAFVPREPRPAPRR